MIMHSNNRLLEAVLKYHAAIVEAGEDPFDIAEIKELANGVLGVLDAGGEYKLYFDRQEDFTIPERTVFGVSRDSHLKDVGGNFRGRGILNNIGLLLGAQARSWEDLAVTAKKCLMLGQDYEWHETLIGVEMPQAQQV